MYRLYAMYVAVLSAHRKVEVAARQVAGAAPSVFAIARRRPTLVAQIKVNVLIFNFEYMKALIY